jgi:hypothetical protein
MDLFQSLKGRQSEQAGRCWGSMLMKPRLSFLIAWALYGLIFVMALGAPVLDFANHRAIARSAINAIQALVFAIPAALIVTRQPRNMIGWLLMFPTVMLTLGSLVDSYLQSASAVHPTLTFLLLAWFSSWAWVLYVFPLLLIALLFPNGSPPSRPWKLVSAAVVVWGILFIILASSGKIIQPNVGPELPNPLGLFSTEFVLQLVGPWQVGLVTLTALCMAAPFARYRRGSAVERTQIKWLMYVAGVFAGVYIIGGFALNLGGSDSSTSNVFNILFALTAACIPIAIAIAVLRYRLWDIDLIIRRTLQYTLLTGVLALVYFGGVVVLQKLFSSIIQESNASLTIVITTLVIAALFNPLRRWLQNFIDRRFYRPKYDAEQAITRFSSTARDEVDMERLVGELLEVVDATMKPEGVSLWLKSSKGR